MKLSIVTTMYRSAAYLREFHGRISRSAARLTPDYEIVFVNDGSPDTSLDVALELFAEDGHVRVVDFSRNFGHHKAMMTGLAHACGERVFLIDCDLEEPPELLDRFAAEMDDTGADVVFGVQAARKGGMIERLSGALFFSIFNRLSTDPIPRNLLTVRLMTRRYVDALVQHKEREILIAGLWAATGFHQVPLVVEKNHKGSSTYTFRRKIAHIVNAVTSHSNVPLVMIFYMGFLITSVSMAAAAYLVVRRLFFGTLQEGWPSIMVSIWFLGGLTIFCLGLIGIYLSKIYIETKQRPYTIVRQVYQHGPRQSAKNGCDPQEG